MTLPFPKQYFQGYAGLTQGPWPLKATEIRCGVSADSGNTFLFGGGQWGAPPGTVLGAQIYAIYALPNGPVDVECQMPACDTAVEAMLVANFTSANATKICAGVANGEGWAKVYTRWDDVKCWEPSFIAQSPNGDTVHVQVRSMACYTDQVTKVTHVFAGADDSLGWGGIFSGVYSASQPGQIQWTTTPELALSDTNKLTTFPAAFTPRVMGFAVVPNGNGGTQLVATIGEQVWQRTDGGTPLWQCVYTKPVVAGEVSQSGLRAPTLSGGNLLVFPEGNDWGCIQLTPSVATQWVPETIYGLSQLQTLLPGCKPTYVIGPYNVMENATVGSETYGLIGLGIQIGPDFPADTQVYAPAPAAYFLGQSHYLVKQGSTFTLYAATQQATPTGAIRFMTVMPGGATIMAGGFDYGDQTEAVDGYGWGAYDTAANVVAGT
jgi:hypothetical protein